MPRSIFIFLLISGSLIAQDRNIKLASSVWPPFTDQNDQTAYSRELVQEALKRSGYSSEMEVQEFSLVITGINDGKYDGSPALWYTEEREDFIIFSKPYLENRLVLVGKKGSDVSARSIQDLNGKRLALVGSYAYGEDVETNNQVEIISGLNVQDNLDLLLEDKADYILVEELVIKYILKFQREEAEQYLEIGDNALVRRTLHFGLRKDLENADDIIDEFNNQILGMVADGTYNHILEIDWIQSDLDGDGVSELVLAGKKAGVEAPKEAYQVPGQGVPKNASLAGSKFLIGGNSYNSWDQVPNSYKTHNSKANNINPAPVNLLKFKF